MITLTGGHDMTMINQVDLAFIVDTTGSMGGLIGAARRRMITMMEELVKAAEIDLQLGVVQYRDHPPQDDLVYKVHPFTRDLKQAQRTIDALIARGGGDGPEAVFDGVMAACLELEWRKHSRRIAVLVGDAPPHGVGAAGDGFRDGCPCGDTIESVTQAAEEFRVTVYALGLTAQVNDSFGQISQLTGGQFFPAEKAEAAIAYIATILKKEFGSLELDRKVLEAWQADSDAPTEVLAERLGSNRHIISASLVRLLSRDLLEQPVAPSKEATPEVEVAQPAQAEFASTASEIKATSLSGLVAKAFAAVNSVFTNKTT
jgi:hypothetical protein